MSAIRNSNQGFNFGLETEFIVIDASTKKALWHNDLEFNKINTLLESISLEGIASLEGLDLEPPHKKLMPYVVEGYHVPATEQTSESILPKGIEIRTPVMESIEACLQSFRDLYLRLQQSLKLENYAMVALSHHPLYSKFKGPQNKRRHDFWLWAMEVMTTYGPDINISLPNDLNSHFDYQELDEKINYYGPAMAALSEASPFLNGDLWKIRGNIGKAFRTYRRSVIAPAVEYHPNENGRIEFKLFEMSWRCADYQNYFLLFLSLILGTQLKGRASQQSRVYDLGLVAQFGLNDPGVKTRAYELLNQAPQILNEWGFDPTSLKSVQHRFGLNITPADELIQIYLRNNQISEVMQFLSKMDFENSWKETYTIENLQS